MKINYPVKYAAMPIIEQVDWSHGLHDLEREYGIVCYIVSKCYLVNECKHYKKNGYVEKEYDVVFPYQHDQFNRWKREIPTYNCMNGYCTNSNKVDEIFDKYEDALNYAKKKNDKICEDSWTYLSYSKDFINKVQEKRDAFNSKLVKYKLLEEQILLNTQDLKVGETKKLDNTIKVDDNLIVVPSHSVDIYEILSIFSDQFFAIYCISQEQYNSLLQIVKKENITEIDKINNAADALLLHTNDGNLTLMNSENNKSFDKNILSFYTTEPFEELIACDKTYPKIDLNETKERVLKKTYNK